MSVLTSIRARKAPAAWQRHELGPGSGLHQLAPYIGKLKATIARDLIERFTKKGDLILDCFAGSGTVPLEAVLLGRSVIALDRNPYAVTLTRAKVEAPATTAEALERLEVRLKQSQRRSKYNLEEIPPWVRQFFHPDTLQDALRFVDECVERDDSFLLACLLAILHHQRPGFLSYPSSHLVPYLRERKFPRSLYPEMYERRALAPRLAAKVKRALRRPPVWQKGARATVYEGELARFTFKRPVDAIVTSPPYMNALDYVRDNRLRMWFLDRRTADYSPEPTDRKNNFENLSQAFAEKALSRLNAGGRCVLVVGETVSRKRVTSHPAERLLEVLVRKEPRMIVEEVVEDEIPDVRRSRRAATGTKRELIVILRKRSRITSIGGFRTAAATGLGGCS
jgi:hypothetical protein